MRMDITGLVVLVDFQENEVGLCILIPTRAPKVFLFLEN
jgi:hypothetical protein